MNSYSLREPDNLYEISHIVGFRILVAAKSRKQARRLAAENRNSTDWLDSKLTKVRDVH